MDSIVYWKDRGDWSVGGVFSICCIQCHSVVDTTPKSLVLVLHFPINTEYRRILNMCVYR